MKPQTYGVSILSELLLARMSPNVKTRHTTGCDRVSPLAMISQRVVLHSTCIFRLVQC